MKRKLEDASKSVRNGEENTSLASPPSRKRRSATPSSRQPSVDFHMTTRRGGSRAASNASASVSTSVSVNGDSRRGSSSGPALNLRASDSEDSRPLAHLYNKFNNHTESTELSPPISKSSKFKVPRLATFKTQEIHQPQKRKRSPKVEYTNAALPAGPGGIANGINTSANPGTETNGPSKRQRDRRANQVSEKLISAEAPVTSAEATPDPENANSVNTTPAPAVKRPPGRPRLDRPVLLDPGSGKAPKRLPGRRRAPNPDAHVEADLLRHGELRKAYRALVKGLKPVLAELAQRAMDEVDNDPQTHRRSTQFGNVKAALDLRLNQRLAFVEKEYQIRLKNNDDIFRAEQAVAKTQFHAKIVDLQDRYIRRARLDYIQAANSKRADDDSQCTDDEDDDEPLPDKRKGLSFNRSYSQFYLEADQKWEDFLFLKGFRERWEVRHPEVAEKPARGFATYDSQHRQGAIASLNILILAGVAERPEDPKLEERYPPPRIEEPPQVAAAEILPNPQATSLQILATASEEVGAIAELKSSMVEVSPSGIVNRREVVGKPGAIVRSTTKEVQGNTDGHIVPGPRRQSVAELLHEPSPPRMALNGDQTIRTSIEQQDSYRVSAPPSNKTNNPPRYRHSTRNPQNNPHYGIPRRESQQAIEQRYVASPSAPMPPMKYNALPEQMPPRATPYNYVSPYEQPQGRWEYLDVAPMGPPPPRQRELRPALGPYPPSYGFNGFLPNTYGNPGHSSHGQTSLQNPLYANPHPIQYPHQHGYFHPPPPPPAYPHYPNYPPAPPPGRQYTYPVPGQYHQPILPAIVPPPVIQGQASSTHRRMSHYDQLADYQAQHQARQRAALGQGQGQGQGPSGRDA